MVSTDTYRRSCCRLLLYHVLCCLIQSKDFVLLTLFNAGSTVFHLDERSPVVSYLLRIVTHPPTQKAVAQLPLHAG